MDALVDPYGRKIDYLRVSITDRCNLRCFYCVPSGPPDLLERSELLSFEEILRVIRVAATLGVVKVRLTGGEPLVRRNVCDLVRKVNDIPGIAEVSLTTNGVLLKQMGRSLFEAGLRRINVSLDTMNPEKFNTITGRDLYHQVWEGITEAESVGFRPLKINVVVVRGVNDDEVGDFAQLAMEEPYAIRFIEYMPIGNPATQNGSRFVSIEAIKQRLEAFGRLFSVPSRALAGPALRYRYAWGRGEIGLIGAVSSHFCHSCNRLRLTSDGRIRPCLFSDRETDVKGFLRMPASDAEIAGVIRRAVVGKPKSRTMDNESCRITRRGMSAIGG